MLETRVSLLGDGDLDAKVQTHRQENFGAAHMSFGARPRAKQLQRLLRPDEPPQRDDVRAFRVRGDEGAGAAGGGRGVALGCERFDVEHAALLAERAVAEGALHAS